MELSNRNCKLLFGDGSRRCQLSIAAGELLSLNEAVLKARERFGLPARVQVVSCYEAGRDGFWLHRYLESIGVENVVVDSASIAVTRRKRRAKTDRLEIPSRRLRGQRQLFFFPKVLIVADQPA